MAADKVISLTTPAFEELIRIILEHIDDKYGVGESCKWISTNEAMNLLQIKSKTTMQQLRTEGKVRYSQPQHKIILYDRDSIIDYIEKHARDTF